MDLQYSMHIQTVLHIDFFVLYFGEISKSSQMKKLEGCFKFVLESQVKKKKKKKGSCPQVIASNNCLKTVCNN